MPEGRIRYWAAAEAAAGVTEETVAADTLAAALDAVASRRDDPAPLKAVLAICSYLVDGAPVGRRDPATVRLPADGWVIEALPPFAGG